MSVFRKRDGIYVFQLMIKLQIYLKDINYMISFYFSLGSFFQSIIAMT